jgi:hypothetical protein
MTNEFLKVSVIGTGTMSQIIHLPMIKANCKNYPIGLIAAGQETYLKLVLTWQLLLHQFQATLMLQKV